MSEEGAASAAKRRRAVRLALVSLSTVWVALGALSLPMAFGAAEIFKQPAMLDDWGARLLFAAAAGFPLMVLASLALSWFFYARRRHGAALAIMLLPLLNFFAGLAGAYLLGWFRQV